MRLKTFGSKVQAVAIAATLPLAAVVINPATAAAVSFTTVYSFGDSLSDTGNTFAATLGAIPPSFRYPSNGRFTNGPVWVEYLAPKLDASLQTLAFGGARTDDTNNFSSIPGLSFLPGLTQQINAIPAGDPDALYVIWAGGNDYLNGARTNPVPIVTNLDNAVLSLAAKGAKNIAVGNLPNLGSVPGTIGSPNASALNQLTQAHNALLAQSLHVIRQTQPGVNIFTLDFNSLFSNAIANPSAFGFTNVTDSCVGIFTACASPSTYLFWDEIHPTTAGHAVLADFAFASVQAQAVPEPPATIGLLVGGVFLFGLSKLRQKRHQPISIPTSNQPSSRESVQASR